MKKWVDAKENAYYMLLLGMCIILRGFCKVTSNMELGYGRNDITLEALNSANRHVIIEFKQGNDIEQLKSGALQHILDDKYYAGLKREVIYISPFHNKKRCGIVYKTLL